MEPLSFHVIKSQQLANGLFCDDDLPPQNVGHNINIIMLSVFPEFPYQSLIYWPVKTSEEVFPVLEGHLFPKIQPILMNIVEIHPVFLQDLQGLGLKVAVNLSFVPGDVICIRSHGDGFSNRRRELADGADELRWRCELLVVEIFKEPCNFLLRRHGKRMKVS